MPAASNGGDERTAHTGAAVTSPAASVTGTVTAGSRSGQPTARSAARQAPSACAAGTSLMNGLLVITASRYWPAVHREQHFHGGHGVGSVVSWTIACLAAVAARCRACAWGR